ncbi:MAG TPA: hypothetical protein VNB24_07750 [Acidimicrobiales bacterium]|nr:hypothetical protein [Acidimicrobiales bacterium]
MKRLGLAFLVTVITAVTLGTPAGAAQLPRPAGLRIEPGLAGRAVTMNGKACNLISTDVATPFGVATGPCGGVRPGAPLRTAAGGCTFNFLYIDLARDPLSGQDIYAGTAGHCIIGSTGPRERTTFADPRVFVTINGTLTHIGDFAYARLDNQFDFALVRLNAAGRAAGNPQMCHFGGPTGLRNGSIGTGEVLQHYGNGVGIGAAVPARSHVALFGNQYEFTTASFAAIGDSGSGMTDAQGRAAGVLVSVLNVAYGSAIVNSTRVDISLAQAQAVIGRNLVVMTAAPL